ncbi:MAG TPA: Holliday junction resolvase RuvX [Bacteroidia bacterium]|nr:Holliday junction resolvase RuvX [Bacteroidia bacterium]
MGRIIAIDYGLKRTGIAVSDSDGVIAFPLETVSSKETILYLKKYLMKEKVDCIVVGMPRQINGSDSSIAQQVREFIREVKNKIPNVEVKEEDERYTSVLAKRTLIDSGVKKMQRRDKSLVDVTSATILLQGYLEKRFRD